MKTPEQNENRQTKREMEKQINIADVSKPLKFNLPLIFL